MFPLAVAHSGPDPELSQTHPSLTPSTQTGKVTPLFKGWQLPTTPRPFLDYQPGQRSSAGERTSFQDLEPSTLPPPPPPVFTLGGLPASMLWLPLDQPLATPGASKLHLLVPGPRFLPQPLSGDPDSLILNKDFLQTTVHPYTHHTCLSSPTQRLGQPLRYPLSVPPKP